MSGWFVACTQPRAEERALWHLKKQGYEVYLPRYRKQVRHARKREMVLRPLFPGYVFVCADALCQRWRSINGTVGVVSLVRFGEAPACISSSMVEAIRAREDAAGVVSLAPEGLKKGDRVRVRDGAFTDCIALLEEVCDEKRATLLFDLMGREVRVNAPMENLAKAS